LNRSEPRAIASSWAVDLARLLFAECSEALLLIDPSGHIQAANQGWLLLSGDSAEDVAGCPIELLGGAGAPCEIADLFAAANADGLKRRAALSHRHRHGFDLALDVAFDPVYASGGKIACWLVRARPAPQPHAWQKR
jgi:hypothetical protein